MQISTDIDAYGQYARLSYLADLVEAHVLGTAGRLWLSRLHEAMRDSGFTKTMCALMDDADISPDEGKEPAGDWLIEELRHRADVLGSCYPFQFTSDAIACCRKDGNYVNLLSLTLAHAHPELSGPDLAPTRDFERGVSEFLGHYFGGRVVHSGEARGKFDDLIRKLCEKGFSAGAWSVARSRCANDDGGDSVAWSWELDSRSSVVAMVVQSTLTTSDKWEKKANEASEERWRKHLGLYPKPRSVLAVPHVAPRSMISRISDGAQNSVLVDRIQLSRTKVELLSQRYSLPLNGVSVDLFL